MGRSVVCIRQPHRIVGAVVQQEAIAKPQDPAGLIKCQLDFVVLITAMGRADEVFRAVFDPFHRAA